MPSEWFYLGSGRKVGPFSPAELRQLASNGVVTRETRVSKSGHDGWVLAKQVKGLFDAEKTNSAEPPPSPLHQQLRLLDLPDELLVPCAGDLTADNKGTIEVPLNLCGDDRGRLFLVVWTQ